MCVCVLFYSSRAYEQASSVCKVGVYTVTRRVEINYTLIVVLTYIIASPGHASCGPGSRLPAKSQRQISWEWAPWYSRTGACQGSKVSGEGGGWCGCWIDGQILSLSLSFSLSLSLSLSFSLSLPLLFLHSFCLLWEEEGSWVFFGGGEKLSSNSINMWMRIHIHVDRYMYICWAFICV